jgi:hypothetical protein
VKGQYVVLDEQELRQITPTTSTEMEIVEFVKFSEIDPVYLETSYLALADLFFWRETFGARVQKGCVRCRCHPCALVG